MTNAAKGSTTAAAEPVARQWTALLESGGGPRQVDNAVQMAALYAKDAVMTDGPTGYQLSGRGQALGGFRLLFSWGGAWRVDQVLADGHWAAIVTTRTRDSQGHKVSAPYVALIEVRNGLVVSHLDIYDKQRFPW